LVNILELVIGY
jgi:hypothetical protein